MATALGVLLALSVWMGLAALATWLLMAVVFRYSSLGGAGCRRECADLCACCWVCRMSGCWRQAIMSLLLIWRHKSNIQNLLAGKESKIGSKKSG